MSTNHFANHLQHSFAQANSEYARLGQMALQAMARPVLAPEIQTPTSAWAGLGFSRSMNSAELQRWVIFAKLKRGSNSEHKIERQWEIEPDSPPWVEI